MTIFGEEGDESKEGPLVLLPVPSLLFFYLFLMPYGAHLCIQAMRVRLDDPRRALALFKSNGWAGLILTVAIVAGTRVFRGF